MKPLRLSALLLILAGGLVAATTPPKPASTVNPGYPEALRDTGRKGSAIISMLIKADGTVGEASIKSADHPAFGQTALEAAKGWTFQPAMRDGAPVDIRVDLPFQFTPPVDQLLNVAMHRQVFKNLTEALVPEKEFGGKPKVKKRAPPGYPSSLLRSNTQEKVVVRFVVGPDGNTFNPVCEGNPRKEFIIPALTAVAHTTFVPPVKNGKPVYVETRMTINFTDPTARRPQGGEGGGGGGMPDGGGGGGGPDEAP